MGKTLDIYFSELNKETQKKYLDFYGIKESSEENLDLAPIIVLEK